jgi:hypothetical protein
MAYGVNAPFGLRPLNSINGGSWTEKTNEYYIYASPNGATTYGSSIFTGDLVVWGTSIAAAPQTTGGLGTIAVYTPNFTDGTPSIFPLTGTATAIGVFQGCEYITPTGTLVKSPYWPASTVVMQGSVIKASVIDDPTVIYDVQVSTNINANAAAFIGNPIFPNTNVIGGAPFPLTGSFGRNFGFMIGGGTNFTTVPNPRGGFYTNNPTSGDTRTGQSGFYLCVDTSTVAANNHDYNKNVTTLPLRALGYTQNANNIPAPGLTMATTPFLNVRVTLNNPVYAVGSAPTVYVA